MQMAVDVARFTAAEADQLRRAMGAKRSSAKMKALMARFFDGCRRQRPRPGAGDADLRADPRVLRLRLPRSALDVVRAAGLRVARGSSTTTRPRSAPGCCARSRWASTARSPWSPTPAATASHIREPDINASLAARHPRTRRPTAPAESRSGSGSPGSATSATTSPSRSSPNATPNGPYAGIGDLTRRVRLKKNAVEALATAGAFTGSAATGGRTSGPPAPRRATRPGHLPGLAPGLDAPALPGMTRLRGHRRGPVGHRRLPGQPPGGVPARAASPQRGAITTAELARGRGRHAGAGSAARSPTGSAPPPPAGSRSSTSRTRPAWPTSSSRRACGTGSGWSPAPAPRCSSAVRSRPPKALSRSSPIASKNSNCA